MAISKFWLDVLGEMVGVEGVLVAFQSLLTPKRGTKTLDFQSNEPPLKFIQRPLPYEVPLEKKNNNNKTLQPYGLYYRQRYSVVSEIQFLTSEIMIR
jgi:hypothetical protein